jgi:hypothetical protein
VGLKRLVPLPVLGKGETFPRAGPGDLRNREDAGVSFCAKSTGCARRLQYCRLAPGGRASGRLLFVRGRIEDVR